MLVLSHPRSGSTEICRIVEACVRIPGDGVTSVGELFNAFDRSVFGNTMDAFMHFRTSTDPIAVRVLVLDLERFNRRELVEGNIGQVLPIHYLSELDITFNSGDELRFWLYDERIRRLKAVNSFENVHNIKHFITLFDTPMGNWLETKFNRELIMSHFKRERLAFSYRKNILETVFSALIKVYYIDNARKDNKDNDFLNIIADGHNLHDMPVLQPMPIKIDGYPFDIVVESSYHIIDGIVITILLLFEFYHLYLKELVTHNILCYEDIIETRELTLTYAGKTQVYKIDDLPPRVIYQTQSDGTVKELEEKKMNYGDYAYEDYFTNSYVVHEVIENEVNKIETRSPGFKETLSKLGIIY